MHEKKMKKAWKNCDKKNSVAKKICEKMLFWTKKMVKEFTLNYNSPSICIYKNTRKQSPIKQTMWLQVDELSI